MSEEPDEREDELIAKLEDLLDRLTTAVVDCQSENKKLCRRVKLLEVTLARFISTPSGS